MQGSSYKEKVCTRSTCDGGMFTYEKTTGHFLRTARLFSFTPITSGSLSLFFKEKNMNTMSQWILPFGWYALGHKISKRDWKKIYSAHLKVHPDLWKLLIFQISRKETLTLNSNSPGITTECAGLCRDQVQKKTKDHQRFLHKRLSNSFPTKLSCISIWYLVLIVFTILKLRAPTAQHSP